MDEQKVTEVKADEIIKENEKESFFKKVGNGVKNAGKKVVETMRKHPIATLITGAVVGSAGTVATALVVNKIVNKSDDDVALLEDSCSSDDALSVELDDINDGMSVDV